MEMKCQIEVQLKSHMERDFPSKIVQETTSLKQFPIFLSTGSFPVVEQTVTVCNIFSIVQFVWHSKCQNKSRFFQSS